jgi:hypothetical protein
MASSTAGNAAAARLKSTTGAWTAITRPKAGLFTSHGASVNVACTLLAKASYLSSLQLIYQSPSRRQHDDERRPFSRLRPRRNPPFVTVGDRLADRKSDSSAGEIGLIVEPLERLEDRLSELLFEPYAIVGDCETNSGVVHGNGCDLDPRAGSERFESNWDSRIG